MSRSAGWIQNYDRSAEEYKEEPTQSNQIMNEKGIKKMASVRVRINLTEFGAFWVKDDGKPNPEAYIEYMNKNADAIEANGLRMQKELLADESYKDSWLDMNHIPAEYREAEWQRHIEWMQDQVAYLERKIKRYRNKAKKVAKEYGIKIA